MIDVIKDVEKQNESFFHDIDDSNLFILGDSESGKTVILQDMLLHQKDSNRKILIISPFDEFHEVVEVSGGVHHRLEKRQSIEGISFADMTSVSFNGKECHEQLAETIDYFAEEFSDEDISVYIDGFSYLFVTEQQQTDMFAKIAQLDYVQFIVTSQSLQAFSNRSKNYLFPTQFILRTDTEDVYVLSELDIQVNPKKFAFAEGLIVGRGYSYLFRYTFCNAYRNLFFNDR